MAKNKILYIAHSREQSAWGEAARNYMTALENVGFDVVSRYILLGQPTNDIPDNIKAMEAKSALNCDVCIQHTLPHYYARGNFRRHIGLLTLDHHNIKHTHWSQCLNLMDELWSMSSESIGYTQEDGIKIPIRYVPIPFDIEYYKKAYSLERTKQPFTFYYIGELHRRKHLASLLRAFHSEFHSCEPVNLLLKVYKNGIDPKQIKYELSELCLDIKKNLRLYKDIRLYKEEEIISEYISKEELLNIHINADCFVNTSYGEAFSIPTWEAMILGKFPISTDCGGMADYIVHERNGLLVPATKDSIIGLDEMFDGIGTGREWWWNINTTELQKAMRLAYNRLSNPIEKRKIFDYSSSLLKCFSYERVGNRMKDILNESN